jgi:hypothetical protein
MEKETILLTGARVDDIYKLDTVFSHCCLPAFIKGIERLIEDFVPTSFVQLTKP